MRFRLDTKEKRAEYRAAMIPKGAIKVKPKGTDAEFYIWEKPDRFSAMCFIGTAAKPAWNYYYKTPAARAAKIAAQIESLKAHDKAMAERKAKMNQPSKIKTGHIFGTCWGYDQTNREFFKVIECRGDRTVIVQELAQIITSTGDMTGKCTPAEEFAAGSKPITCRVSHGDSIKVEGHYASLWDGMPKSWTAYA